MARGLLLSGSMERTYGPTGITPDPIPEHFNSLTARIIGCAIEVHKALGPGLLESAYDCAFCVELAHEGLQFQRQLGCPVTYRGRAVGTIGSIFRSRTLSSSRSRASTDSSPYTLHKSLTYLKATGKRLGLLINFNVPVLKDGIRRVVL